MWRTLIVTAGERLTVNCGWLNVYSAGQEARVPIGDLYSVVIDNRQAMLSVAVLTTLSAAGVHILFCDEKHLPVSELLPLNTHYQPLMVVKSQLEMEQVLKDKLWQRITEGKIRNQSKALRLAGANDAAIEALEALAENVWPGDEGNREAQAAKRYFPAMFGTGFRRSNEEDVTNAALNYGYAILRSALCKTLVAYGYNCVLGIHHIGRANAFNLADDLIEPWRPIVDLWVDDHWDDLYETLTKSNRTGLIDLVNHVVRLDGKKMRVRYAIDQYIKSFTAAVSGQDAGLMKLPTLLKDDPLFEDEQDG